MTELHEAARAGNHQRVIELLNEGINENAKGDDGWTALHKAAI